MKGKSMSEPLKPKQPRTRIRLRADSIMTIGIPIFILLAHRLLFSNVPELYSLLLVLAFLFVRTAINLRRGRGINGLVIFIIVSVVTRILALLAVTKFPPGSAKLILASVAVIPGLIGMFLLASLVLEKSLLAQLAEKMIARTPVTQRWQQSGAFKHAALASGTVLLLYSAVQLLMIFTETTATFIQRGKLALIACLLLLLLWFFIAQRIRRSREKKQRELLSQSKTQKFVLRR
jgi:hypothetical protein